jgi:N-acetylneuraminate synthase
MISDLQKDYPEHVIGYSDHTKPDQHLDALMLAYSLGARIIEKHFTLNKNLKGNDHYHSMDEQDLLNLFKRVDRAEKLLGKSHKAALEEEEIARINARRSLFYASDFKFGQVLYPESYIALRPGTGLSPMEIDSLQGKVLIRDVSQGELVQIDDFL